jgi:hypothetical protein
VWLTKFATATMLMSAATLLTALALAALLLAALLWLALLTFLRFGCFFGQTFRRQTGGDILRAFDFLLVTFAVEETVRRFLARHFRAGFRRSAVRLLLLLALVESATRAKTHTTATAA